MPDSGDGPPAWLTKGPESVGATRGAPGSDEEALSRRLLGFFAACARATRRQAGVVDVFESGSPVLALPADVWQILEHGDVFHVEGAEVNRMYGQYSVAPTERPLTLGSLFFVGRHGRRSICAPLLTAPLNCERTGPAEFELSLAEDDLELNFAALSTLAGGISAAEEDAFQYQLSELLAYIPEVPLTHDAASVLVQAIDAFMDVAVAMERLAPFRETDLSEELSYPELRLLPTHAWFVGREPSAFTVVQELESLTDEADMAGTAFVHALVPSAVSGASLEEAEARSQLDLPPTPDPVFEHDVEALPLTEVQRSIVRSARAYPLTVVTGPPGTGKSYTIAAMILDQLLGDQKVLMFSHTEKAVEVVVDMLEKSCGPFVVARSGNRRAQRELAKKLDLLLEPGGLGDVPTKAELDALSQDHIAAKAAFAAKAQDVSLALDLVGGWSHHSEKLVDLANSGVSGVSAKALSQDPAKLQAWYSRGLDLLQGGFLRQQWGQRLIRKVRRRLRYKSSTTEELARQLAALDHTQQLDALVVELSNMPGVSEMWAELRDLERGVHDAALALVRAKRSRELGTLLSDRSRRTALSHFKTALRAAENARKRELLGRVPVEILQWAFPCWASTDRFLSHILPLMPRLFDLAVVDEASQCDLAAASPALYRARRAVVVGDPNQLRHVTFLSRSLENSAIVKHEIAGPEQITHNFRRSVFDVAADNVDQGATFLLDEHFRSVPSIIRFPAERFYRGQLRLMTERPERDFENAVRVAYVDSPRDSTKGPNTGEAKVAIDHARQLMASGVDGSIGLLSPFRAQVDLLRKLVAETFTTEEIDRHQMAVGTAHVLQGDERDSIILSLAMDRHFHHNQLRWLERETGVLNVSITRARRHLTVLASMRPRDLPNGILKDFLLYAESQAAGCDLPDAFDTRFEQEVCWAIRDCGYRVFSQYPSAGFKIDLVATNGLKSLGIECDGPTHFNPDGEYRSEDVVRHLILTRAGWDLLRIPYRDWQIDPERFLGEVEAYFAVAEGTA